jgi:hypothetical protein
MLRLASDENFNGAIHRGLLRREPDLDLVRAQDAGLIGSDHPTILDWAASPGRNLLTHDRATIPDHAYERIRSGLPMPGVVVVGMQAPIGTTIGDILLLARCGQPEELDGRVLHLPL